MPGDADAAVLAQQDPQPPEAAGVRRHVLPDRVEDPSIAAVRAVASVRFSPHGWQSGLSRRSTSSMAAAGSTVTRIRSGTPSATPGNGSCAVETTTAPAGSRSDRRDHPLLA